MKHQFIGSKDWHASWPKISIHSTGIFVVLDETGKNGEELPFNPNDEDKKELLLWMEETL